MNWEQLLRSMDEVQFNHITSQVYNEKQRRTAIFVDGMLPPNETEIKLYNTPGRRIDSVKLYKARACCDLLVAKAVLDKHLISG